ncbi:MAG: GvpL/GvpF family gas vesicle protein [Dehalobacterium sp.]
MENRKELLGFLEEDIDMIIQEAKQAAMQYVRERLALSFENILWEEAQKRIKGVALQNDELLNHDPVTNQEKKKIYLFGITGADAEGYISQSNLEGMVYEDRVYPVIHKDLAAVVCQVTEEEFNEFKMQELIENRDWWEEKIERHKKVLSLLAKDYPVIPMRFSSLYPCHHQLRLFMEENYRDLMDLLNKIRDKTEWGLKLFLNVDKFKMFLQEKDESINNLIDEVSLNQTGKGYFPQKRLANRIESKAFDLAEEVHRRLCRFSQGAVLNKLIRKNDHEKREQMILNGAYLVEQTQEEEFLQVVKWLEETEGEKGFIFKISGPRPCYNFCHISSTGT